MSGADVRAETVDAARFAEEEALLRVEQEAAVEAKRRAADDLAERARANYTSRLASSADSAAATAIVGGAKGGKSKTPPSASGFSRQRSTTQLTARRGSRELSDVASKTPGPLQRSRARSRDSNDGA